MLIMDTCGYGRNHGRNKGDISYLSGLTGNPSKAHYRPAGSVFVET